MKTDLNSACIEGSDSRAKHIQVKQLSFISWKWYDRYWQVLFIMHLGILSADPNAELNPWI